MCDTFLALPSVTRDKTTILSKNSDREPAEAQAIQHIPGQHHSEDSTRCTFIEIEQVRETYSCILSKPFQMWGAEMGVNQWGVAIGNEAVFTKVKHPKRNDGLTGMDLLRLALERSRNAEEALNIIIALLEQYGQDACGGYRNSDFFYHNSFIIADPHSGWILETAGKEWAARQVKDIGSISNRLSISAADRYSTNAQSFAKLQGWWNGRSTFDFSEAYSDRLYTWLGRGARRQACTQEACEAQSGQLTSHDAMHILQTHNLDDPHFTPKKANTGSVCMHRTSILNPSDTTGSMVAELRTNGIHTIWLTGTPHPCLSIYVPYFTGTQTLQHVKPPGAEPDQSLWWKAKELHRWINKYYPARRALIQEQRTALQQDIVDAEEDLLKNEPTLQQLENFSNQCLQRTEAVLDEWIAASKFR